MFVERVTELLGQLFTDFMTALPNFLGALIIFIIGWLIAKIVASMVRRILKSLQVDKLAERLNEMDIVNKSKFTIVPSTILSKIIYYILLLVFAIVATEQLNMEVVSQLVRDIISYIPNVIAAMIVLAIGLIIADILKSIVQTAMQSIGIPSAKIIAGFLFYFILIMTVMTAIRQLGIETDFIQNNLSLIIGGGVLAFAIGYGLASKNMMANFLASFYSKGKFKVGDVVGIDGSKGRIIEMDSTSLVMISDDKKKKIIIPLSRLTVENVELYESEN